MTKLTNHTNKQKLREQIRKTSNAACNSVAEDGSFNTDEYLSEETRLIALITAHTNKQIAKVLERLESELNEQKKAAETNLAYHTDVTKNERLIRDWQGTVHGIEFCRPAIAAERAKLKEVK